MRSKKNHVKGFISMGGNAFLLFLIGLFSETQIRIIGSIGISELLIYLIAPIIYIQDLAILKHDKFNTLINLGLLCIVGSLLSSWYNDTLFPFAIRGFAGMYSLFAYPVVFHRLLRRNLTNVGWLFLGIAFSGVITIFFFRNATEVYQYSAGVNDAGTLDAILGGQLFWLAHFGMFPVLPIYGWYFATPQPYAIIAPLILTVYTIFTSASGRSAILCALLSSFLIFIGGRSRLKILRLQKNLLFILLCCGVVALSVAALYKYAGTRGLLNEKAQQKYESQMNRSGEKGFSPLKMIMGGRIEFFAGLYACLKYPIFGKGPWAFDYDGLYGEFLAQYGNEEDYLAYEKYRQYSEKALGGRVSLIPAHSHIISFWLNGGILCLPYWLYVLYLIWTLLKRYLAVVPQWYGYFACMVPGMLWNIFFSPYAPRIGTPFFLTMILFARAISEGRINLPIKMVQEIARHQ